MCLICCFCSVPVVSERSFLSHRAEAADNIHISLSTEEDELPFDLSHFITQIRGKKTWWKCYPYLFCSWGRLVIRNLYNNKQTSQTFDDHTATLTAVNLYLTTGNIIKWVLLNRRQWNHCGCWADKKVKDKKHAAMSKTLFNDIIYAAMFAEHEWISSPTPWFLFSFRHTWELQVHSLATHNLLVKCLGFRALQ